MSPSLEAETMAAIGTSGCLLNRRRIWPARRPAAASASMRTLLTLSSVASAIEQ